MDISVVIPLLNEEESLPELESWIRRVMDENNFSYEIIFVDDGSTDASWHIIQNLSKDNPNVKALRFRRNYGKSPALNEGFKIAEGDVVITMDASPQKMKTPSLSTKSWATPSVLSFRMRVSNSAAGSALFGWTNLLILSKFPVHSPVLGRRLCKMDKHFLIF